MAQGLAGRRDRGPASRGPVSREKLSTQQWTRLEQELRKGKTLIGRLFRVGYTAEGVWKLMRRHGRSVQVPVRQALERDEDAVAGPPGPVSPAGVVLG